MHRARDDGGGDGVCIEAGCDERRDGAVHGADELRCAVAVDHLCVAVVEREAEVSGARILGDEAGEVAARDGGQRGGGEAHHGREGLLVAEGGDECGEATAAAASDEAVPPIGEGAVGGIDVGLHAACDEVGIAFAERRAGLAADGAGEGCVVAGAAGGVVDADDDEAAVCAFELPDPGGLVGLPLDAEGGSGCVEEVLAILHVEDGVVAPAGGIARRQEDAEGGGAAELGGVEV